MKINPKLRLPTPSLFIAVIAVSLNSRQNNNSSKIGDQPRENRLRPSRALRSLNGRRRHRLRDAPLSSVRLSSQILFMQSAGMVRQDRQRSRVGRENLPRSRRHWGRVLILVVVLVCHRRRAVDRRSRVVMDGAQAGRLIACRFDVCVRVQVGARRRCWPHGLVS